MNTSNSDRSSRYDVVVLGSGIAGSAGALALSRTGARVLVVERGRHPRFAIGESMVPTTTHGFDLLARRYRIPELARLFRYPDLESLGCRGWPKRHFWFGLHEQGRELERSHQLMFDTFRPPRGPDVHMVRADADSYLVSLLPKYGVDFVDRTDVVDVVVERTSGEYDVVLALRSEGASGHQERRVSARLVLDASGHASFCAHHFGLRQQPCSLETDTRALFGHFRNVSDLDSILGEEATFHYRRQGGTMHHCFAGGWIWVIPFDDGSTSVGVVLDRKAWPRGEPSAWPEMKAIIERFPSVERHLGAMEPVFEPIGTDRIQFSSSSICAPGVVLSPHAAGFVDPLFSSGFLLTAAFLLRFVPLAQRYLEQSLPPSEAPTFFRELERCYFSELDQVDRIVSGTIASFRSMPLFRQYWRTWVGSTYRQFVGRVAGEPERCSGGGLLYGTGSEVWQRAVRNAWEHVTDGSVDPLESAARVRRLLDETARADALEWPLESNEPTVVDPYRSRSLFRFLAELERELGDEEASRLRSSRLFRHRLDTGLRAASGLSRYAVSRVRGDDYYQAVHRVRNLQAAQTSRLKG